MRDIIKTAVKSIFPYKIVLYIKQLEVVFRCFWTNSYYEPEEKMVLNILKKQSSGCVIDVGLNLGQYSLPISKIPTVESVIAIEPQKRVSKVIKLTMKILRIKKVQVYEIFVGRKKGFANISLQDENNQQRGQEAYMDLSSKSDKNQIEVDTLDNVVQTHGACSRIYFIKVDVEGAEMQVLLGAQDIIEKDRPFIMLELQDEYLQRFDSSVNDVMSWMKSKNYFPYFLDGGNVTPWKEYLRSNTGNYLFFSDSSMAKLV